MKAPALPVGGAPRGAFEKEVGTSLPSSAALLTLRQRWIDPHSLMEDPRINLPELDDSHVYLAGISNGGLGIRIAAADEPQRYELPRNPEISHVFGTVHKVVNPDRLLSPRVSLGAAH